MSMGEKFCLKWNDFQENIKASFGKLRECKDFSDVTLVCDDGEMEAHKVVLSSCSPFFQRLLQKVKHHHQHPLIFMRGLKSGQLTNMVDFIYHGEVNILQEDLEGFLQLAEELELKGLTGGAEEEAGMGKQKTQKESNSEFYKSKYPERLKTENYATSNLEFENANNKRQTQNEDSNKQTLVSTEVMSNLPKPKVHIGNDILQMRETMFEKVEGRWTCKVCNFSSINSTHLREHVEKHIEGVEYPCNQCGKIMRSSKSLRNHYNGRRCSFSNT